MHAKAVILHQVGRFYSAGGEYYLGANSRRPALRGDSGYGNEGMLLALEERGQPYLLRLRQTANVQRLVARQFARPDCSRPDTQGCQMVEDWLQLQGLTKKCRVVVVSQRIKGGVARERRADGKQLRLDLAGPNVHEGERLWEYAVLVMDAKYPIEAIGQLYRDRADCGNGFDGLKNQWGGSASMRPSGSGCSRSPSQWQCRRELWRAGRRASHAAPGQSVRPDFVALAGGVASPCPGSRARRRRAIRSTRSP